MYVVLKPMVVTVMQCDMIDYLTVTQLSLIIWYHDCQNIADIFLSCDLEHMICHSYMSLGFLEKPENTQVTIEQVIFVLNLFDFHWLVMMSYFVLE